MTAQITPLHARELASNAAEAQTYHEARAESEWRQAAWAFLDACFNYGCGEIIRERAHEFMAAKAAHDAQRFKR